MSSATLLAYLTVLVAAAIPWLEVLLVVPAGILAGLPPVPVAVVAAIGNALTLWPLVLAGDRVRAWWRQRRRRRADAQAVADPVDAGASDASEAGQDASGDEGRSSRARRLFDRYGLPGLAGLGPLLTGIHVAAVVALAAGAHRRPTLVWLTAGVVVWSALTALLTVVGLDLFFDPDALPDLGI